MSLFGNPFPEVVAYLERREAVRVAISELLEQQLGRDVARTLQLDEHSRWAFRFEGRTYVALVLEQVRAQCAALKAGHRPKLQVQHQLDLGPTR